MYVYIYLYRIHPDPVRIDEKIFYKMGFQRCNFDRNLTDTLLDTRTLAQTCAYRTYWSDSVFFFFGPIGFNKNQITTLLYIKCNLKFLFRWARVRVTCTTTTAMPTVTLHGLRDRTSLFVLHESLQTIDFCLIATRKTHASNHRMFNAFVFNAVANEKYRNIRAR